MAATECVQSVGCRDIHGACCLTTVEYTAIGLCDEHHANFTSIETVFGRDAVVRVKTCKFHYKQSVRRRMRRLPENIHEEFDTLAPHWL